MTMLTGVGVGIGIYGGVGIGDAGVVVELKCRLLPCTVWRWDHTTSLGAPESQISEAPIRHLYNATPDCRSSQFCR